MREIYYDYDYVGDDGRRYSERRLAYDPSEAMGYDPRILFVYGPRGCGKTYYWKNVMLETEGQLYYIRETERELLEAIEKFHEDLKPALSERLEKTGNIAKGTLGFNLDQERKIWACTLKQFAKLKGAPSPLVTKVLFDEFEPEAGYDRSHIKNPRLLMSGCESVFRRRRGTRCVCLGNFGDLVSPYLAHVGYSISDPPVKGYGLNPDGSWSVVVQRWESPEYAENMDRSSWGKVYRIMGQGEYMTDGIPRKGSDRADCMPLPKDTDKRCWYRFKTKVGVLGYWRYENYTHLSRKYDPATPLLSLSKDDHGSDSVYSSGAVDAIRTAYRASILRYDDMAIKGAVVTELQRFMR